MRWLVIGAGLAGRCHIAAIKQTQGAELNGVVDSRLDSVDSAPLFKNIATAIHEASVDVAVIAAPNTFHAEYAVELISHKIPTLVEKPVGTSLQSAQMILSHASEAGVPVGVVLNQRVHAHIRWLTRQIHSGAFHPTSVVIKGAPPRLQGWHANKSVGGGLLKMIGLHYVDLLVWWFGLPEAIREAELHDHAANLAFKFPNGCASELKLDAAGVGQTSPIEIEVLGGNARVRIVGFEAVDVQGLNGPPPVEQRHPDLAYGPGHLTLVSEANTALAKGEGFPIPLRDVLPTLKLIEQIESGAL